jgi:hypothetical protein
MHFTRIKLKSRRKTHFTFVGKKRGKFVITGLEPISYRRALFCMPQYKVLHNLLNILVQIANRMGIQDKVKHYAMKTYGGMEV